MDQPKKILKEQYKNREITGGVYGIRCNGDGKLWLRATTNLQGAKNRFAFSVSTCYCPEICMRESWEQFGASAFGFEEFESMKKKETQSAEEFAEDTHTLLELWTEKLGLEYCVPVKGGGKDAKR